MQLNLAGWLLFIAIPFTAWVLGRVFGTAQGWRGYFFANQSLGTGGVANTYFGANLTFTAIFMILSEEAYRRGPIVLAVPCFWLLGSILFVALYSRLQPFFQNGTTLHQALAARGETL